MKLRRREAIGLLAAAATLPGCAPEFAVREQAEANPFAGQRIFKLVPLDFASAAYTPRPLSIRATAEVPARPPIAIFALFNSEFRRGLSGTWGDLTVVEKGDGFGVQPIAVAIDPGFRVSEGRYTKFKESRLVVRVRFTAPGGAADEIEVLCSTPAAFVYSDVESRLGHDGLTAGRAAGEHLKRRSGG